MIDRFKKFVQENKLFADHDRILLAFSGGPDSVALADLLHRTGTEFALAHVNFHLRGKDADEDQVFSRDFAQRLGVEFFTIDFDTKAYARDSGLSVEEAARKLRYDWFETLSRERGFDLIATAHNADDNVETILHNLARGTGIRGLLGIPLKRGKIIRPLLFAFKDEILRYCEDRQLSYRIDHTNDDITITRNRIRHVIIPEMKKLNPAFKENVLRASRNLSQVYAVVKDYINACIDQITERSGDDIIINKQKLQECEHKDLVLYEYLASLGLAPGIIDQVGDIISSQPGKFIETGDWVVLNDRGQIIITRQKYTQQGDQILITEDDRAVKLGDKVLRLDVRDVSKVGWKGLGSNEAALDLDKLSFPLILRHWHEGDYFYPLGLGGRKKLSDFFVDQKIPLVDKKRVWILESGGAIAWVVGMRIDDRFKVTKETKRVLKLTLDESK